jgi:hypothetical protein
MSSSAASAFATSLPAVPIEPVALVTGRRVASAWRLPARGNCGGGGLFVQSSSELHQRPNAGG